MSLGDEVKSQDIYMPLAGLRAHPEGIEARWKWLMDNWETVQKRLPPGLTMLSSVVQICSASFTTEKQWEEVQAFFKGKVTKVCDDFVFTGVD